MIEHLVKEDNMSSLESFDGLCGIIHVNSTSEQQVRCKYEFGHYGEHSWVKNVTKGPISGFFVHDTTIERSK